MEVLALEVVYQSRLLDQNRMLSLRFNHERLLRSVTGVDSLRPNGSSAVSDAKTKQSLSPAFLSS